MFSTPVTISNRMPPTSISSETRSSSWAIDRAGGQAKSLGITDHSLASTTGTMIRPSPTCRPWLRRYSHDGSVGQSKVRQFQPSDVRGCGLAELRPVRDVGQQAGQRDDRQRDQQHRAQRRRQPQPPQRTAPTRRLRATQRPLRHRVIVAHSADSGSDTRSVSPIRQPLSGWWERRSAGCRRPSPCPAAPG